MAWHLYLVPIVGSGTLENPRRPKYLIHYSMIDYGFQPVALAASDVDEATDAALQINADVHRLPDDLDQPIGPVALAIVQDALETRNLPAQWVTNDVTYRVLLRTLFGFFSFVQRYAAVSNTTALLLGGAVNLNTRINQLPASVRQNLQVTATDLGLSSTGISGATTIRQVLKNLADQWGQRPYSVGGISI